MISRILNNRFAKGLSPENMDMRSKYGEYPEYHTLLEDLTLVSPTGLEGGYNALLECIKIFERNVKLKTTVLCEPQLGKCGLYPEISTRDSGSG